MSRPLEIATLGRLLERGAITAGARNAVIVKRLETARWILPGNRRNEWHLRDEAKLAVEARLVALFSNWKAEFAFLRAIERDPFDAADIEAISMLRRNMQAQRTMINRRNWNAATGLGPKHSAKASVECILTKDWVLRFRPNKGLFGYCGQKETSFWEISEEFSECTFSERGWLKFDRIGGQLPQLIVTCENIGPFVDFPKNDSILVVYMPGDDIEPACNLVSKLDAPWIHFGDLDPRGIDIAHRVANVLSRPMRTFVPSFTDEYLEVAKEFKGKVKWGDSSSLPAPVQELCRMNRRIFQEIFMLDDRLPSEVENILRGLAYSDV